MRDQVLHFKGRDWSLIYVSRTKEYVRLIFELMNLSLDSYKQSLTKVDIPPGAEKLQLACRTIGGYILKMFSMIMCRIL